MVCGCGMVAGLNREPLVSGNWYHSSYHFAFLVYDFQLTVMYQEEITDILSPQKCLHL
jgi:hypothetical protein